MVCVMNPSSRFQVRLSADHNQLTLRIDGTRLHHFLAAELGYSPRAPLEFHPHASIYQIDAPGLARMVEALCNDFDDPQTAFNHHLVRRHFEDTLLGLLLSELPHNYSAQLASTGSGAPRVINRVRDYIEAHPQEALSVSDLARAASTSTRSLQQAFGTYLGTTPMSFLRARRLELARQQMLSNHEMSVTDVALACGFTHLSRFARYYRERFGETPLATRRR